MIILPFSLAYSVIRIYLQTIPWHLLHLFLLLTSMIDVATILLLLYLVELLCHKWHLKVEGAAAMVATIVAHLPAQR